MNLTDETIMKLKKALYVNSDNIKDKTEKDISMWKDYNYYPSKIPGVYQYNFEFQTMMGEAEKLSMNLSKEELIKLYLISLEKMSQQEEVLDMLDESIPTYIYNF